MRRIAKSIVNTEEKNTYILTSRFNTNTTTENREYCRVSNPALACIYSTPVPIDASIPDMAIIFILEMNNDTNRIMGIGILRNSPKYCKYLVHCNSSYNTYTYSGKYRISREEMNDEEEKTMLILDMLCFTGTRHQKRLSGITVFPEYLLQRCKVMVDIRKRISDMVIRITTM
jgi:hypothetical protein